jgi:hypothetical protein
MKIGGLVGEGYRKELYAGEGCCSSLNSWRQDVKPRNTFDARSNYHVLDTEFQVFIKCLASQFISSDVIFLALGHMKTVLMEQKNYSDEESNITIGLIAHHMKSNRSSFTEDFMG